MFRMRQLEEEDFGEDGAQHFDDGLNQMAGCKQKHLLKWYYNYLTSRYFLDVCMLIATCFALFLTIELSCCRKAIKSHEEGLQEVVWAEKIISHLIKKEQVCISLLPGICVVCIVVYVQQAT